MNKKQKPNQTAVPASVAAANSVSASNAASNTASAPERKLRILMLITHGGIGGAQRSVFELSRALVERGHEVVVGLGGGAEKLGRSSVFLVSECGKNKIPVKHFRYLSRGYNLYLLLMFIIEARNYLLKNDFDVLHLHSSNCLPIVISNILSIFHPKSKIIFTFHGLSVTDNNHSTSFFARIIYRIYFSFFLRYVDQIVYVCIQNLLSPSAYKYRQKSVVIPNGIDCSRMYFYAKKKCLDKIEKLIGDRYTSNIKLTDKLIVGSIGRFNYPKNFEYLINNLFNTDILNKDYRLILVGEGPDQKKYEHIIRQRRLSDKVFIINLSVDAYKYLKAFDIFILPSIYEGMPLSVMEAMCAKIPILANSVGGITELIMDRNQLFSLGDPDDFARKLKNAFINSEETERSVLKNFKKICSYSLDATANRYEDIYY